MTATVKHRSAQAFCYQPEDLKPTDHAAALSDEAANEAFIARNSASIAAGIEQARAEFERGDYFTLDQVMADIDAQRQRRRSGGS